MKRFYKTTKKIIRHFSLLVLILMSGYAAAFAQVIAPNHFITEWQGQNGQNHMNFMVVSAILEDMSLGANDEIAVFSGLSCVGAKKLSQAIISGNSSTYLIFAASADDGTNNGFTVNDTIIFKIWDSKNKKEMLAKAVKYRNDISSWLTDGRFTVGATAIVEIDSYTDYTQSIPLLKGANLFSSYVIPANSNVGAVMKPQIDQKALINIVDEAGLSFEYLASTASWINKIGSVSNTEGYSISLNLNSTLNLTGKLVSLPLNIPLKLGWNFISFPRMDLVNAMTVIQPLIDQKKLLKVQDEKGFAIEKIKGKWVNNIGNFAPGKGYKINVNAASVLTIQKNYIKSVVSLAQPEKTEYFIPNYEGNGSDHMNINLTGLTGAGLSVGDEMAAFDGAICVGTLKLTEDHFSQDLASIVATSIDRINQNGFSEGNPVQIYKWNKLTGDKSVVQAEIIEGELKYEKNASVSATMKSLTTSAKNLRNEVEIEVFPNPAITKFTVRYSQIPEKGSTIEVTDLSGRKIASRVIQGISEEFNIGYQPAGLYLVKSVLATENIIQKLMIVN